MINIVQFGANTGNDHVTKLLREKIIPSGEEYHLYLVEPVKYCIPKLLESYKDVENKTLETAAIVPDHNNTNSSGQVEIFYGEDTNYAVSSLKESHVTMLSREYNKIISIKKLNVRALTPNELFFKWVIKDIDYLFIDIEGFDHEVINSINLSKYNVNFICWEHQHSSLKETTTDILFKQGFTIEKDKNNSYAYKRKQNESYISDIRQWI
tara:strand:+ start:76 stop:705 length:630 start_codon:yes stop_codon:yes gene_type:complete